MQSVGGFGEKEECKWEELVKNLFRQSLEIHRSAATSEVEWEKEDPTPERRATCTGVLGWDGEITWLSSDTMY